MHKVDYSVKDFDLQWKNKVVHIGKHSKVAVNQLVGINHSDEYFDNIVKIDMWKNSPMAPDIITDVSMANLPKGYELWQYVLNQEKFIAGTVPIYNLANQYKINGTQLLKLIEYQLDKGVKIITIHATPTVQMVEKSQNRIIPFTSRGGGIVIRDLMRNKLSENIYMSCLDEIITLCKKYNAVISLGTTFRSANIFDSMDELQKEEILAQLLLAERIHAQNVRVLIELPGHASPKKIDELNNLLKDNSFPIMPLGPIVTDVGVGMDHITAAIGLTLLGTKGNVQVITAVTAEEHTGNIPSVSSTMEAIKTARLVAHIIDMDRQNDYALDYQYAMARKETCVFGKSTQGCSRCGEYCPLCINTSENS